MLPRKLALIVTLSVVAVSGALFAAACGDDDSGLPANAEVINAIDILDSAGLHDMEESITDQRTIPATTKTTMEKLQAVINLTSWPDGLESKAKALSGLFADLAIAVDGDNPDMTKAAEAATRAHDGWHDFSHQVWEHLYEESGVKAATADGH